MTIIGKIRKAASNLFNRKPIKPIKTVSIALPTMPAEIALVETVEVDSEVVRQDLLRCLTAILTKKQAAEASHIRLSIDHVKEMVDYFGGWFSDDDNGEDDEKHGEKYALIAKTLIYNLKAIGVEVPSDFEDCEWRKFCAGFEHLQLADEDDADTFIEKIDRLITAIDRDDVILEPDIECNDYDALGEWLFRRDVDDAFPVIDACYRLPEYVFDYIDFEAIGFSVIKGINNDCSFTNYGFFSMTEEIYA